MNGNILINIMSEVALFQVKKKNPLLVEDIMKILPNLQSLCNQVSTT